MNSHSRILIIESCPIGQGTRKRRTYSVIRHYWWICWRNAWFSSPRTNNKNPSATSGNSRNKDGRPFWRQIRKCVGELRYIFLISLYFLCFSSVFFGLIRSFYRGRLFKFSFISIWDVCNLFWIFLKSESNARERESLSQFNFHVFRYLLYTKFSLSIY